MIPSDIKFDANATPPQWTDNGDQIIEKGTNIRIKIKGLRSEVDKMYAIGTMKEVCLVHRRSIAAFLVFVLTMI
jgi:DNA-directed RNA polymerase II subunit RPB7